VKFIVLKEFSYICSFTYHWGPGMHPMQIRGAAMSQLFYTFICGKTSRSVLELSSYEYNKKHMGLCVNLTNLCNNTMGHDL
jgi:hypothetical protein